MPATLGNLQGALSGIIGSTEAPSARQRVEKVDVPYKNTREVQNKCDLGDNDLLFPVVELVTLRKSFAENEIPISIARYERGSFFGLLFGGGCRVVRRLMMNYFRIVSCGLAYGVVVRVI